MLVFTYGSLMSGLQNHEVIKRAGGQFVKNARIVGTLHAYCSAYPAVVTGDSLIKGEVYEVPVKGVVALDSFEGEGYLYHRRSVMTEDGDRVSVYMMTAESVHGRPIIADGDWRRFKEALDQRHGGGYSRR